MTIKPLVLIILDGWGYRENPEANAILKANTPNFDRYWNQYPHTLLTASGKAVGLPEGQMGNSEVGHLNIGAGRVVYQDLTRISKAVKAGDFFKNKTFIKSIDQATQNNKAIHIFGLLSSGGIHSHIDHILALIQLSADRGAKQVYVHAFLDGRDMPPKSAENDILKTDQLLHKLGIGKIASIIGRFYAMDRDKRWDRVEKAYDLLTLGTADNHAPTAIEALNQAYKKGETDEFVKPTSIHFENEKPVTINDGDTIIFMNFRADRAREITRAFINPDFHEFSRKKVVSLGNFTTLTEYDNSFDVSVAFPPEKLTNTLGKWLSKQHKKQLRIAETEKYAHVTFFLNAGIEKPYKGETRTLIPSPKIETYDLKPEMSAEEVTNKLLASITNDNYDFIVCNFANPDMVGHTGNFEATVKAIEFLDHSLEKIVTATLSVGGEVIITADHGNAEQMFDPNSQQAHTAHTTNPVPFIYIGRNAKITLKKGALCDIAPTILRILDLPTPKEMTGKPLIKFPKDKS